MPAPIFPRVDTARERATIKGFGGAAPHRTKQMTTTLKFFYNGIKVNGGKLQKAFFSKGNLTSWAMEKYGYDSDTLTVYAREYAGFSAEIRGIFQVENDSDMMTDYFEKDRIRVTKGHPLYGQVLKSFEAQEARQNRVREARLVS